MSISLGPKALARLLNDIVEDRPSFPYWPTVRAHLKPMTKALLSEFAQEPKTLLRFGPEHDLSKVKDRIRQLEEMQKKLAPRLQAMDTRQ